MKCFYDISPFISSDANGRRENASRCAGRKFVDALIRIRLRRLRVRMSSNILAVFFLVPQINFSNIQKRGLLLPRVPRPFHSSKPARDVHLSKTEQEPRAVINSSHGPGFRFPPRPKRLVMTAFLSEIGENKRRLFPGSFPYLALQKAILPLRTSLATKN